MAKFDDSAYRVKLDCIDVEIVNVRSSEILKITWRTHARAAELPSDTDFPQLGHDDAED